MNYRIKQARGHVEVFDMHGNFLFSADTEQEAVNELRKLEAA